MEFLGLPLVLCQQCAMKRKTRREARFSVDLIEDFRAACNITNELLYRLSYTGLMREDCSQSVCAWIRRRCDS